MGKRKSVAAAVASTAAATAVRCALLAALLAAGETSTELRIHKDTCPTCAEAAR